MDTGDLRAWQTARAYFGARIVFVSAEAVTSDGGHSDVLERVSAERESVDSEPLEHVVTLAVELAREGCEDRTVGTIFTVGDADASGLDIPGGLGSRHRAAAAITRVIDAPVLIRSDDQVTVLSRAE